MGSGKKNFKFYEPFPSNRGLREFSLLKKNQGVWSVSGLKRDLEIERPVDGATSPTLCGRFSFIIFNAQFFTVLARWNEKKKKSQKLVMSRMVVLIYGSLVSEKRWSASSKETHYFSSKWKYKIFLSTSKNLEKNIFFLNKPTLFCLAQVTRIMKDSICMLLQNCGYSWCNKKCIAALEIYGKYIVAKIYR